MQEAVRDDIHAIERKFNAMDVSSEFQAKIFRVIPLVLMSKDATQDISFIILVCEDDESLFNHDLRQLKESEYLPLDTYDTLLINCATPPVEVSCTLQTTEAVVMPTTMERINVASLIESKSVKRSFRLPKIEKDVSSICLLDIQQKERESLGVSFALQIKDNNDRSEDHTSLANILLGRNCQSPLNPKADPIICFVLPYINGLQNLTDDVVITVWLCSFDNESEALKELEQEQYHVGRIKLDSPNTFIILDKDKPITVEVTGLQAKNKVQSVATKRVSEGGHAKVQFVCQLLHKVDENSWIDLDITVKQEEEPNKIQFISRKKVCIVPDYNLL
ncbi:hypothetical protein BSL78_19787 [Apostichopus japonicus]|uniref:Uncharacterized protein n=1 Tax=Stichopus japonicus TaxID=307972 RepID=A0A2G8K5X9_STIJA|nr:hypothetical protein BSL78_19787 [Apostichopus japonicus]